MASNENFRQWLRRMRDRTSTLRHQMVAGPRRHVYPVAENERRNRNLFNRGKESLQQNHVTSIDVLATENGRFHHTRAYEDVNKGILVVRRGWPFCVVLNFLEAFEQEKCRVRFSFQIGEPVDRLNTPEVTFYLTSQKMTSQKNIDADNWSATVLGQPTKTSVKVTIQAPPTCIVSDWRVKIDTLIHHEGEWHTYRYSAPDPWYILFNPWCKDDPVFFPEQKLLDEFILNDSGVIFHGNRKQIGAKPWFYGQFEGDILEVSLDVIKRGLQSSGNQSMADPVSVARIISKMTNAPDDGGVIVGNWSNNYTGGKSPMAWTGSVAILKQYFRRRQPVKYGQCFVFAGIVTTICRAVGIPCRSITNFASGHDSDGSVTIDTYWDGRQKAALREISDSVWNFHCWNEVWMKRSDLPDGYDGWQVLDSTPQERSQGMFQCGPASVRAIREGRCDLLYDSRFVFAEVNADHVIWIRDDPREDWKVLRILPSAIGHKISTKVPDGLPVPPYLTSVDAIRQDVTQEYKYPEDSEMERSAVMRASREALQRKQVYPQTAQDVIFSELQDRDFILIGQNFDVKADMFNSSQSDRTILAVLGCEAVTYTGEKLQQIKQEEFRITLKPKSKGQALLRVFFRDYKHKLSDECCIRVNFVAYVLNTKQRHAAEDDFRLRKPDLTIWTEESTVTKGTPFTCLMTFDNPLDVALTGCTLTVDGAGVPVGVAREVQVQDVPAAQTWKTSVRLSSAKAGWQQISATFSSRQISDIQGVLKIYLLQ